MSTIRQFRSPHRLFKAAKEVRQFHDLPRRAVMEECAFNATHTKEIAAVFHKTMRAAPVSAEIVHRTGSGQKVTGSGDMITVKEAKSKTPLAHGKAALASEIDTWVQQLTPREDRKLHNGVDVEFLDQLQAAVNKLKKHPKLANVCAAMANECHKPAPSIDVEMGEFLYGLSDSFNVIREANQKGMTADNAFLPTASGRKAKHVVGGHPSNFVVYVCPVLEAIALGWPSVILNHPQVPTAASQFIDLLEECGVNFNGKLVHATTSNIEELCKVFKAKDDEISQGILIAGLNMGRTISQHAPNTKQELSGSNELIMTPEQYRAEPTNFLNSLKINLGYSAGKQCTAPSKLIFAGFKDAEVASLKSSLQTWSDATQDMPARELKDFTSNVPFLFNNDPGNEAQFKNNTKSFTPFVTGHRAIYRLNDDHKVDEVFGPATAFQFVDNMKSVKCSDHSLSMGVNVDVRNKGTGLVDFLKDKDLKYLPSIINVGFNASTLAATPTGEAFLPWHYTLSGQDVGMGPHAPLRFSSFQVSKKQMEANSAACSDSAYRKQVDGAVAAMQAHAKVFGKIDSASTTNELLSNAVESDKSLLPTLNGRVLDEKTVKMTLYMGIKIDEPSFIRLTAEDTPEIRRNMVYYTLQLARQGIPVQVSAGPAVDGSVLRAFEAVTKHAHVSVNSSSDAEFTASLNKLPQTVVTSDEELKIHLKNDSHFLTVFPPTKHTPFLVVGLKPQTVKVSGSFEDCKDALIGFVKQRKHQSPVAFTDAHIDAQVTATQKQITLLTKKAVIAKYEKFATPHYKGKVQVVAAKTEGIRTIEADGTYYLDCNLAYGAAKAGFSPDLSAYNAAHPYGTGAAGDKAHMSVLPSQAMYSKDLSDALERLSNRYGPLLKNPNDEIVQVCLLNTGGEIMDSIQQAVRRHGVGVCDRSTGGCICRVGSAGNECVRNTCLKSVVLYPRGNFNGRREHANKLNQHGELPLAFHENGALNVDSAGRCFIEFNDHDQLAKVVAACKKEGRPVSIIWEPIQGEGGIFVSSPEFVKTMNTLQARDELLIVADEVQTGFAGSKADLGMICSNLGVKPDILALAKSLTLGKVAAAAAFLRGSLASTAFPPGVDGGTFSGMPYAMHCILAGDDFWHKTDALDRLYKLGNDRKHDIGEAVKKMPNKHVKAVKGVGSMGAVQFNSQEAAYHYHHLFLKLDQPGVMHESFGPLPTGLKGIIQKLSGKDGSVMRMTSGLSPNQEDQQMLTKLISHLLTHPHYYPHEAKA